MLPRRRWLKNRKEPLTLLSAIVLSLMMMLSDNAIQTKAIRVWSFAGFGLALEKYAVFKQLLNVYHENEQLRRQSSALMLENSQLKEASIENQRLRELLTLKGESEFALVPAQVIGRKRSGLVNVLLLDSGLIDSIAVNMPVVTADGLVGKIHAVAGDKSMAQLLLDRNIRVSAINQRSRVRGIIRWNEDDLFVLEQIPKRSDIRVGDTIVTSPLSSVFPTGLKIGEVVSVSEPEFEMFLNIKVEPFVDFGRLEEVFVVRSSLPKSL